MKISNYALISGLCLIFSGSALAASYSCPTSPFICSAGKYVLNSTYSGSWTASGVVSCSTLSYVTFSGIKTNANTLNQNFTSGKFSGAPKPSTQFTCTYTVKESNTVSKTTTTSTLGTIVMTGGSTSKAGVFSSEMPWSWNAASRTYICNPLMATMCIVNY